MAKEDYGILISEPGSGIYDPEGAKLFMNTSNPFIKIDTQNRVGFQSILLLITNDPPNPAINSNTYTRTVLYQFKHGYSYVPSVEHLFKVITPPPSSIFTQDYFLDIGVICQITAMDYSILYATADDENVYLIVEKWQGDLFPGTTNILTGTTIQITSHVFVEDIGV